MMAKWAPRLVAYVAAYLSCCLFYYLAIVATYPMSLLDRLFHGREMTEYESVTLGFGLLAALWVYGRVYAFVARKTRKRYFLERTKRDFEELRAYTAH